MGAVFPQKVGVLLANTGTPDEPKPSAVRTYLSHFLSDPCIVPMNRVAWWIILHLFVLPFRGRSSAKKYAAIWTAEGSPLTVAQNHLAFGLQHALENEDVPVSVTLGMSYSHPFIEEGLSRLREAGCTRVVVLPLYPQPAFSTTESVRRSVERGLANLSWNVPWELVDGYDDSDTYIEAIASTIRFCGFGQQPSDRLLFSYHSIPLRDVRDGDTYGAHVASTNERVARALGLERSQWRCGFHSRFQDGRKWLSPFSVDILQQLGRESAARVFVVCPNFAVDCLETLYDMEYELKPRFFDSIAATGVTPSDDLFRYVPCLGGSRVHVSVLASVLRPYIEERKDGNE